MSREVLRRVGTLLTGTTVAQLLPILTLPVVAQTYSTEEFGMFGLFLAANAITTTLGNLKYDTAILATSSKNEIKSILGFCIATNFLIATLIGLLILVLMKSTLIDEYNLPPAFVLFLPLSFIFSGGLQALSTIALRNEFFTNVARSRIIGAAAISGFSVIAALVHPSAIALMLASLGGQIGSIATLLYTRRFRHLASVDFRKLRMTHVTRKYWRFAVFTSPADFLNASASNLPALILGALYGTAATGAYVLAQRLVGTPLMLIGSAFSDVYRQNIGQLVSSNQAYWNATKRMLILLLLIGFSTLTVMFWFAPKLIDIFLGAKWNGVGGILQILIFVYVVRFVVSPLTYNYYIAQRHGEDLFLQICSVSMVCVLSFLAKIWQWNESDYLVLISITLSCVYVTYGIRSLVFAKKACRVTAAIEGYKF